MSAPENPNLIDEQALDDYLKRGSELSQRYRGASGEEPPAVLDRRVLDMARDAVGKSNARLTPSRGRPNWMRWSAPLALAASAVLVVSIVIESGVQNETALLTAPAEEPQAEKAESPPEPALHDHAEYERVYAAPAEAQVDVAADAAKEARIAPTAAPPSREEKVVVQTAPVEVEPPAQFAPSPPPPSVASAPAAENALPEAVESRRALERSSGATARVRSDAELSQTAVTSSRPAPDAQAQRDPNAWLEEIRALRKAGREEEADLQWQEFQRTYPEFPVEASDAARQPGRALQ